MRFDPQANFVKSDGESGSLVAMPPADSIPADLSAPSPLKTALVILALGIVGSAGFWLWTEGVPVLGQQAAAQTNAGPSEAASVVQYAEALIHGKSEIGALEILETNKKSNAPRRLRTRVREEYDTGRKLMAVGRHQEAVPHFAEAIRLDPEFAEGYYRMGLAYVQLGQAREAKQTRARLARINSDLSNLLGNLIDD